MSYKDQNSTVCMKKRLKFLLQSLREGDMGILVLVLLHAKHVPKYCMPYSQFMRHVFYLAFIPLFTSIKSVFHSRIFLVLSPLLPAPFDQSLIKISRCGRFWHLKPSAKSCSTFSVENSPIVPNPDPKECPRQFNFSKDKARIINSFLISSV